MNDSPIFKLPLSLISFNELIPFDDNTETGTYSFCINDFEAGILVSTGNAMCPVEFTITNKELFADIIIYVEDLLSKRIIVSDLIDVSSSDFNGGLEFSIFFDGGLVCSLYEGGFTLNVLEEDGLAYFVSELLGLCDISSSEVS